jgi:hypothetical protein
MAIMVAGLLGGCGGPESVPATPVAQSSMMAQAPGAMRVEGVKALYGIAAVGAGDAWAVGETDGESAKGAVAHWDGVKWSKVATISEGIGICTLRSVAARAKDDVWAVGRCEFEGRTVRVVMAHWDGKSWETRKGLGVGTFSINLTGVAAVGPQEAWGVGYASNHALIMHWKGTAFEEVPAPKKANGKGYRLTSVAGVSPDDVWAVGEGLVLHWDGKSWQRRDDPGPKLTGVAALSANDVWAVGYADYMGKGPGGASIPYLGHWDGTKWTDFSKSYTKSTRDCSPSDTCAVLSISALSKDNIWIVGVGPEREGPILMRWDGSSWDSDPCPSLALQGEEGGLSHIGVAAASGGEVWAVTGEGGLVVDVDHHAPCPPPTATWTPIPTDTPIYLSPTPYGYEPPTPVPTVQRPAIPPGPGTTVPNPVPSAGVP